MSIPSSHPIRRFALRALALTTALAAWCIPVLAQDVHATATGSHTLELRGTTQIYFTENDDCPGDEFAPPCIIRSKGTSGASIGSYVRYQAPTDVTSVYSKSIGVNIFGDFAWLGKNALLSGPTATPLAARSATGSLEDEVAADTQFFYWSENDRIYRTPVSGGATELVVDAPGPVENLVADGGGGVLYTASFDILYHTVPGATPGSFVTAIGPANVMSLTVDQTHVYAAARTGGGGLTFTLYRAPLANIAAFTAGVQLGTVGDGDTNVESITNDETYLYFYKYGSGASSRVINRLAKSAWNGSPASIAPLTPVVNTLFDLVTNGQALLYRGDNLIWRLDLQDIEPVSASLSISEVVVNQGVSGIDSFILIEDKPGIVWVEPSVDELSGVSEVTARVDLRRLVAPGVPMPGTITLTQTKRLAAGHVVNRDDPSTVFQFELPLNWRSGGGEIEATIRPVGVSGPVSTDVALLPALGFRPKTHVCVKFLPLALVGEPTYFVRNPLTGVFSPGFLDIWRRFETVYPVPEMRWYTQWTPLRKPQFLGPTAPFNMAANADGPSADSDHVMGALLEHNITDSAPDYCGGQNARTHYVAMVPAQINTTNPNTGFTTQARGSFGEPFSWLKMRNTGTGFNSGNAGLTMAHEFGHNTNNLIGDDEHWQHVRCGIPNTADFNNLYPFDQCSIGLAPEGPGDNNGVNGPVLFEAWGHDRISGQRIGVTEASDYLASSASRWASFYRWGRLMQKIEDKPGSRTATRAPAPTSDVVAITGLLSGDENAIEVLRLDHFPPGIEVTEINTELSGACMPTFEYALAFVDANGVELDRQPLNPTCSEDDFGEGGYFFHATVPHVPDTAKLFVLRDEETELWSFDVSSETPEVTINNPLPFDSLAGGFTVEWDAFDPDGDVMTYSVQYRIDGADTPWMLLASGLTETAFDVPDPSLIPGSSGAEIRVLASDGYNVGSATVDPLDLPDNPPAPAILYPLNGAAYTINDPVPLNGRALDPETGDAALDWILAGPTTSTFSGKDVLIEDLAPGLYDVTLNATDGSGNLGATTSTFVVEDKFVPTTSAPQLDGFCDDTGYAVDETPVPLRYGDGRTATARYVRSGSHLYVCMQDLERLASPVNSLVTLSFDTDAGGGSVPQAEDLAVRLFENGGLQTQTGAGPTVWSLDAEPTGVEYLATVSDATRWAAEVRIDLSRLGGWDHFANIALSHADLSMGETWSWPRDADNTFPATWGRAAFGGGFAQSIAFPAVPDVALTESWVAVNASATSGLPVTLTSLTPAVCNPDSEGFAHFESAGTCTLVASQPGNAVFAPAADVSRSFLVLDASQDSDGDGVPDVLDNCTLALNPDQIDVDGDGFGNQCDADFNNDCIVNALDLGQLKQKFFTSDPLVDMNGDGVVNALELGLLKQAFFEPPGPSGTAQDCD